MEIIQGTFFGKMSQEHSAAMMGGTSQPSLQNSSASLSQNPPMCLVLKRGGPKRELYFCPSARWLGEHTMLNFGELPNAAVESRLSWILEDHPLPKYYLSRKSCQGILNRAKRRGKILPEPLRKALEYQAGIAQ